VSDDTPNNNISPLGDFLTDLRERILAGTSVYGDPQSPRAVERLAELDAKLVLARQLGEAPAAPEPWSIERAAKERMAHEWPNGDPAAKPVSETMSTWAKNKLEGLSRLSSREQGNLAGRVAEDFAYNTSAISMNYSYAKGGQAPTGHSIVEQLLKDAAPALTGMSAADQQLLRCDRQMLEFYANRGKAITAYAQRKSQLGIK
jgi:hypothetical protein